ncbi:MAG: diguanylate cyclase [Rhodocyclales bacterium]|nr:diguanylate cyclase [Rhodocyclales bacterium]
MTAPLKLPFPPEILLDAQSRADIGLFIIEEGRVVFTNEAMCRLFGYTMEEMKALPSYLELAHPVDRERVAQNHQRRLKGEQLPNRYDIAIITKSGARREVEITASPISTDGRPGVLVVMVDNTERKRAEARVQYLALHDALTGLANRVLFFDRLNSAIVAARRKEGAFSLLYLDLDDFKPINDTFGHEAGDLALRSVAERLRDCVRESDTVARLGGDEFILLVNDTLDEAAAITVAEKTIATLTRPLPIDGCTQLIGCSIGIVLYPRHGEDADSLMRHADAAMYNAKRLGKNRYLLSQ